VIYITSGLLNITCFLLTGVDAADREAFRRSSSCCSCFDGVYPAADISTPLNVTAAGLSVTAAFVSFYI